MISWDKSRNYRQILVVIYYCFVLIVYQETVAKEHNWHAVLDRRTNHIIISLLHCLFRLLLIVLLIVSLQVNCVNNRETMGIYCIFS